MKRKRQSIDETQQSIAKMAEMTEANSNLLRQLDEQLKAIQIDEARFQIAVAGKLSRIEAMAQLLGYSDIVNSHLKFGGFLNERVEKLEEMIREQSREIETRMLHLMQGVTSTRRYRARTRT